MPRPKGEVVCDYSELAEKFCGHCLGRNSLEPEMERYITQQLTQGVLSTA